MLFYAKLLLLILALTGEASEKSILSYKHSLFYYSYICNNDSIYLQINSD